MSDLHVWLIHAVPRWKQWEVWQAQSIRNSESTATMPSWLSGGNSETAYPLTMLLLALCVCVQVSKPDSQPLLSDAGCWGPRYRPGA